jgi:ABC-type branched-subunit amino acid transport system substrate-binding protein
MQRRHFMLAGAAGAAMPHWAHAAGRTVRIGQSASLTGTQTQYGKDVSLGLNAAFAAANRAEGAGGLSFELQALDDAGVKERVASNAKTLIDGGAHALVGFTSGIGAQDCLPLIQQTQIPLIGTASGNMGIRVGQPRDCTAHVRAGYDVEYKQIIAYVRSYGFNRVGFVYLQDTSKINLATLTAAMDEAGLKAPMSIGVDRNGKDAEEAAKKLLGAKLDCVVFTTNATPALAIAKTMVNSSGYAGMLFASSLAGQDLINGVPQVGRSMVMSLVVPRPTALGMGVVSQCARDVAAVDSNAKLGVTVLEGYIAGRVTVEAARQAAQRGEVTRARLLETLANLKVDLGGYRVAYEGGHSQGSRYVELVVIDRLGRIAG